MKSIRVCIVSRDLAFVTCIQSALRVRGIEVLHTRELESANRRDSDTEISRIDVLLIETHELDNGELSWIERIRDRFPLIEIVVLSSESEIDNAVDALRSGAFAFLSYPVSDDQLAETLNGAAERKRRGELRIKALKESTER